MNFSFEEKFTITLKTFLWGIWGLPQFVISLIIAFLSHDHLDYFLHHGVIVAVWKSPGIKWLTAVSLGEFIFIFNPSYLRDVIIRHEYGHSIQSRILGPLYLLLVGLPSLAGYWWQVWFQKKWSYKEKIEWYYSRYPEDWADKLGGVER